jgi:hypothetical protein
MNDVVPLFHSEDRFTAANSIYCPEAPMVVDVEPEDPGPNVNCGNRYDADPLEWISTRAMFAASVGFLAAMVIIAVLPW